MNRVVRRDDVAALVHSRCDMGRVFALLTRSAHLASSPFGSVQPGDLSSTLAPQKPPNAAVARQLSLPSSCQAAAPR